MAAVPARSRGHDARPLGAIVADPAEFANWLSSIVAADERVHVLLQDPVDDANPQPRRLLVTLGGGGR